MVRRTVLKRVAKEPYWIVNSLSRLDARLKSAFERYLPPPHPSLIFTIFFSPSPLFYRRDIYLSPRSINILESLPADIYKRENVFPMFSNIFISDERKRVVNKFERETIYIIFPFLPLSFSSKFFQDATNTRPRTTISKLLFFERRGVRLTARCLALHSRSLPSFRPFSPRFGGRFELGKRLKAAVPRSSPREPSHTTTPFTPS